MTKEATTSRRASREHLTALAGQIIGRELGTGNTVDYPTAISQVAQTVPELASYYTSTNAGERGRIERDVTRLAERWSVLPPRTIRISTCDLTLAPGEGITWAGTVRVECDGYPYRVDMPEIDILLGEVVELHVTDLVTDKPIINCHPAVALAARSAVLAALLATDTDQASLYIRTRKQREKRANDHQHNGDRGQSPGAPGHAAAAEYAAGHPHPPA